MKTYVEKSDIEARIKDVGYLVMPDGRTTICTITMVNGFTVNGFSACVDAKNFDAALGRKYSYENAFEALWPLEGHLLAERLHRSARGDTNEFVEEQLKWHAELQVALMDMLGTDNPFSILPKVAELQKPTVLPTHRCKVCGALWKEWDDGSWSLRSERCGSCCDNEVMGNQIEPLPKFS